MQPDLLSAQREEGLSESLPTQGLTPSESLSTQTIAQPEPISGAQAVDLKPALPTEKKRSKLNIAAIVMAFLVLLLFLALGSVGFWAYILNTELTTTQAQLAVLQSEHGKLQTDYTTLTSENEKLKTDLTQSQTDLEKANTDLARTQADVSKSKEKSEKLNAQIDAAVNFTEILYILSTSNNDADILKIDRLVTESKDQELTKQWDAFTQSPSENAFVAFLDYLILAIRDSLK
jgi:septal ring factor EnvC (AmiA/AmiB activator)